MVSRDSIILRHYPLVALLTLAVVLPRSVLIERAHSESWDDQYHLVRGMYFWVGHGFEGYLNDPPLGEAILALPMLISGCSIDAPTHHPDYNAWNPASGHGVLYGQPLTPERILQLLAIWKSVLFVPVALLVFHWCRKLYGVGAAWLALAVMLVDPTMAAHLAVPALDVLAMSAFLVAIWLQWEWSTAPKPGRFIAMCLATAGGMLIKNTLLVLPLIGIAFVVLNRPGGRSVRVLLRQVGAAGLLTAVFIWALTGFDMSVPSTFGPTFPARYDGGWSLVGDVVNPALGHRWPAGMYVGSLAAWMDKALHAPVSFVLGELRTGGTWYYYPVVAFYKVPVGLMLIGLTGIASLWVRRPTWNELGLAIPLAIYGLVLLVSPVQPGFRHALPAYLLCMMLASRVMMLGRAWWVAAWAGVLLAGVHSAMWFPNYLSYINWPRQRVWLQIGDPNLDWGQSLKQVRSWIDTHAAGRDDIYLVYEGNPSGFSQRHYLGDRVRDLPAGAIPSSGLLIISPLWVSGVHPQTRGFAFLRESDPVAIIGDCMLVFDLSHVRAHTTLPDATNPP